MEQNKNDEPTLYDCVIIAHQARHISGYDYITLDEKLRVLQADAQRYRAMRLVLCEQDKPTQARMLEAVDKLIESHGEIEQDAVTPEVIDTVVDKLLLAIAGARNG